MGPTSISKHCQIIELKESNCIIDVASSTQLVIPVSTVKIFSADIKKMSVWSIVQNFFKIIPKAKLGSHSHGNMKQSAIAEVTEPTLDVAYVATTSAQAWYGAYNDVVVTGLVVQCGNSPECAASPGV